MQKAFEQQSKESEAIRKSYYKGGRALKANVSETRGSEQAVFLRLNPVKITATWARQETGSNSIFNSPAY